MSSPKGTAPETEPNKGLHMIDVESSHRNSEQLASVAQDLIDILIECDSLTDCLSIVDIVQTLKHDRAGAFSKIFRLFTSDNLYFHRKFKYFNGGETAQDRFRSARDTFRLAFLNSNL